MAAPTTWRPRLWSPAATAPGGRFYIYPQLLDEAMAVRRCFRSRANLHNLSRTQYLFELDALDAAVRHPLRTTQRESATSFLLPLLAFASRQAGGDCASSSAAEASARGRGKKKVPLTNHAQRQATMLRLVRSEVDFAAGPHLLPCTCVMQRGIYGSALFELLSNESHRLVALSKSRQAFPESPARLHVIAPYHSPPPFRAASLSGRCGGGGGGGGDGDGGGSSSSAVTVSFAGSPETTRQDATCVRRHVLALGRQAPRRVLVSPSTRRAAGGRCGASGTCVDGFHYSRRHEAATPAKVAMAALMGRSTHCLVPEGDSPEPSLTLNPNPLP